MEAYTGLTRNLLFRKGVLSLKAGFAYKKGKGNAFEDGTLANHLTNRTVSLRWTY